MALVINCTTGEVTTVDLPPSPPITPKSVTNLQFRKALRASNRMAAFKTYYAGLTEVAQEEWQFAAVIIRDSPMVAAVQAHFSLSDAQIDDLFRAARRT